MFVCLYLHNAMDTIKFTSKQPRSANCNVPSDFGAHESVLQLSRCFVALGAVTVCSAFFNIEKSAFWPRIVFMYLTLFYEKAAIICLKLSDWFFCLQKFTANLLHIFVVYTQHTKHLIPKLTAHEEISKCRCLDTHTHTQFLKLYLIFIFFKLYLSVF